MNVIADSILHLPRGDVGDGTHDILKLESWPVVGSKTVGLCTCGWKTTKAQTISEAYHLVISHIHLEN